MPVFPSGTVAFLFTDIEGSTKRWERDPAAMRSAVERHFALLDAAIAANHGVHFKTIGDAVQAAFSTIPDAVAAALAAQLALGAESWGDLEPLRVRMALHAGAAEPRNGDYLAPALNRLARLLATGHGGQVLLTSAAADLARDALPTTAALRSLGEHRLRDLQHAESVFQLIHPGLAVDFPPLKSLDVQRHNLPPQSSPLFGRHVEVPRLVALVQQPDVRLVTLTGVGGVGKTRLALAVASELLASFADGVWFVDLAPLRDPGLVQQAVARVLDVHEEAGRSLAELLAEFVASRQLLLVLDNFEQLLSAAPLVSDLLQASPASKALVTSRAPLRLRGEREAPVLPLSVPEDSGALTIAAAAQSAAVQLFLARATAIQPGFVLTAETAPAVIEICRRLDGLPLAIELAAARLRMLPPEQLLARLDDRLRLLTGGPRDAPARQQTLRQTIAWSYDLLLPPEQALFRRLAVFAGHPTLMAIEAVADSIDNLDVFDGVASLVENSLVVQSDSAGGEPRFAMLQTVRAFGLEQLAAGDEEMAIRNAHARFFREEVERTQSELFGPEQGEWFDRIEADHDDLRAVLRWLLDRHEIDAALRFVESLWRFWLVRGSISEGRAALAQALDATPHGDPLDRARALIGAGTLAEIQGDFDQAAVRLTEALALAEAGENDLVLARTHAALAVMAFDQGDFAHATHNHEIAISLYQSAGLPAGMAQSLTGLGTLAAYAGDTERAVGLLNEAAQLFRSLGDDWGLADTKANLGQLAFANQNFDRAIAHSEEALAIYRRLGDETTAAMILANLGEIALHQQRIEHAVALAQEGLALAREHGDKRHIVSNLLTLAGVETARGNWMEAAAHLQESVTHATAIQDKEGIALILAAFAPVALGTGQALRAAHAAATAEAIREAIGVPLPPVYLPGHERLRADARASLGAAEFERAWSDGRSLIVDEALAAASKLVSALPADGQR